MLRALPLPQPSLKVVVTTQVRLPVVYIFHSVILNGGNGHWVHIVVAWLHAQALRARICIKWLFGAQPLSAFSPFDGPMSFPWGTLSAAQNSRSQSACQKHNGLVLHTNIFALKHNFVACFGHETSIMILILLLAVWCLWKNKVGRSFMLFSTMILK